MRLVPGTRLDSYEILGPIGSGGMGEVYRARDSVLKRDIAIKVLPAYMSQDSDRLRRFEQEAQAAAALNHPNILAVYQFGSYEGAPYLVSELLEGDTLRQVLSRGPIPVRKAIDYGVQIAHGLAAAHEKGIVHRDLKPENLFVTKDGRVKILDFGLAKLIKRQPESDGAGPTQTQGTEPGLVMGTVGYMAPEQVRGKAVDHHADIFAFGAILYEMLTGNRAFHRATSADPMSAILNDDPPVISQVVQSTPPGLQRVVHRCLEKNPEQRFQSVSDLAFALEALSDSGSASTVAVGKDRRSRWMWVVAAFLVVAALAIGWYVHRTSYAKGTRVNPPTLEEKVLTESGKAIFAAITPDGRYVAYVNRDHGKAELRLLQVATERDVQILPWSPLTIRALHFSPDGNFIYFLRQLNRNDTETVSVYRVATLGGPATLLATDARYSSVTVSPDGKLVAYIARTQTESLIVAVDPDGSDRRILARRPIERDFYYIEWSPTAERMAAIVMGDALMAGLVSIELPSGSTRDLSVTGWVAVGQPAWGPDGATIFAPALVSGGNSIMQIWAFDANSGAHRPLTSGPTYYQENSLSATAMGDLIANRFSSDTSVWVSDPSSQPRSIPSVRGEGDESVAWVGNRIVTNNFFAMMVHETDGSQPAKLRSYSNIYRELSSCGPGQVAYWANDSKRKYHIARTDVVTGSTSALTDGPLDTEPTCTADGSTLVFWSCAQSGSRCSIKRRSLETGLTVVLYELGSAVDAAGWPTVSPDGASVFFWKADPKNPYDWAMIVPLAGGEAKKLKMPYSAVDVDWAKWAPDGKSILCVRHDENGVGNIWSVPLDGKAPRKITNFESENIYAFDVSPDNRLVMSRGHLVTDIVLIKNVR